jgi:hypothetical protein
MKTAVLIVLLSIYSLGTIAQNIPVDFSLSLLTGYNGPETIPFWMRSNQFGSIPPKGASIGLIGSVQKEYHRSHSGKFDWGFGAEGRLNVGDPFKFILLESYGKVKYGIFELKAGRVKEITGLCDTLLSSGSWAVSGNALGIPKIELSIPEFVTLPILGKLFAIKGSYVFGFLGNWYLDDEKIPNTPTYLIQHTLYGRLGKPDWKLKLFGGFNHQVVWGNERAILGDDYELNGFQTFIYANLAKSHTNGNIRNLRVGNHLGSIDMGLTYDFSDFRVLIYRQWVYDAGALYYLANLRDGLNGLSLTNTKTGHHSIEWKKIVLEFLYTKNQGGETWSPHTTSLFENYYNNSFYDTGWSYKSWGIGTPFITPTGKIREDLPEDPFSFFTNNRVTVKQVVVFAQFR